MIVLGFDTATSATAVGLRLADGSTLEARDDPPAGGHPGHATKLLGMAHRLLDQAGLGWGELDRLAVGVGPGTFTGLRVGVATARGLAQSLSLELVGVSSLRALAQGASRAIDSSSSGLLAAIDARRGEAFMAAFDRDLHELLAPRALAPELIGQAVLEAGSEGPWTAIGDGAVRYRDAFEALGVSVPADSSDHHRLRGGAICELASTAPPATGYGEILPDYHRRPDAELALAAAQGEASSR
jgi:tRNA threonylcarbamoyladenosine biosynthesis protein TsaB